MRPGGWERRRRREHLDRVASDGTRFRRKLEEAAAASAEILAEHDEDARVRSNAKGAMFSVMYGGEWRTVSMDFAAFDYDETLPPPKKRRRGKR